MTDYEKKFIKFYNKFSLDSDNAKTKLETYADELEYAYSLSQTLINPKLKNEWKNIWDELNIKLSHCENHPFKSSISHSLHGKRKTTIERYLLFFHTEYNRIKEKNNLKK
ncbi:hypothetical protein G1K75_12390 [Tenacibaculum finnmarkense]|uniref:hypothetical protein n=1 Tax=Tenacibaculum finnmarkense TaxID=2781243 RepID=UPI001E36013F|nr:hypothetical protein [Tenacibaculum finnmarkense]MCD8445741.1 hypothetical protein [Tenacibaculum finnmarkense genomovar ulcerans]MCG8806450.1 hypothetical protein [Tenacibaculum finnmarkense]WCC44055.1 hypothetical protein PJW08_09575 [Tenacibaculum finnmarkense]